MSRITRFTGPLPDLRFDNVFGPGVLQETVYRAVEPVVQGLHSLVGAADRKSCGESRAVMCLGMHASLSVTCLDRVTSCVIVRWNNRLDPFGVAPLG